jgi:hypothetical protein
VIVNGQLVREKSHKINEEKERDNVTIVPVLYTLKKKVFYETKKGSSPSHTGRSFFGFAKRRFRMKLLLGEREKWFRTKGSVRNLYRKKSKRFRTNGFVPNPSRIMSKRFRTDGFALNSFRIMSKRFRTDGFVRNLSRHIQITRKLFQLRSLFRVEPLCIS